MLLQAYDKLRRVTPDLIGMEFIKLGSKKITSAQILALNATPITVVPAPGTGLSLMPIYSAAYTPGGTAYAGIGAGEDVALRYSDGSGVIAQVIASAGWLDQTTVQRRLVTGWQSAAATPKNELIPTENAALVLQILAGEITTGNYPLWIEVYGYVVPTTLTFG